MKDRFLYRVAKDLYEKFGEENALSEVVIITPANKSTPANKAKYLLNGYFSKQAAKKQKTIWSPEYAKLTQLFANVCNMQLYDDQIQTIELIWELYKEYEKIVGKESFDEFYFFGEILLNDFCEIDKYLVNTNYIFKNLNELKSMQDFSFLDEKQIEILKKFMNFDETKLTQDFSKVWNNLREVYVNFTEKLKLQKIGYDGLIMREVAENIEKYADKFTAKKYAFIGFNSFSDAEKVLLSHLKNNNKAIFYWDSCKYLSEEKMKEFNWITNYYKNELEPDNFSSSPKIEFAEAVNSIAQVGFIPKFIENKTKENEETAIVLCDEKILPAVLSVIPKDANIAILSSASQSRIANLLVSEMKNSTAKNPAKLLEELLEFIAAKENEKNIGNFEIEAISKIKKMLNNLTKIAKTIDIKNENFIKIIRKILFTIKIPYKCNKNPNLQIMAIQDTMNMDFDNILMLSVNEGVLPKLSSENSFIPQSIKKVFGMPTMQMQDFNEQYNFFRLIQRAKNVAFAYNTGKTGTSKAEKSRFLMKLEYEKKNIEKIKIDFSKNESIESEKEKIIIEKEDWMLEKLKEKYDGTEVLAKNGKTRRKSLSPSAFNEYVDCSLKFYFQYIAEIKYDEEKELNPASLGNIFHKTMELIYDKKGEILPEFFDNLNCEEFIKNAFIEEGFENEIKTGEGQIFYKVISTKMLKSMLEYDKKHAPFEIVDLETPQYFEKDGVFIGGIIDRIDKKDGEYRIVDYKTGGRTKQDGYEFQTYLYSRALATKFDENKISSELIFVLESKIKEERRKYCDEKEKFEEKLNEKFNELFDLEIPFKQCEDEKKCKYCDYAEICGRE